MRANKRGRLIWIAVATFCLVVGVPTSANHLSLSMDYQNNSIPTFGFPYRAVRPTGGVGASYDWDMDDTSAGMFRFHGTSVNWNPVKCQWGMGFLPVDMTSSVVGSSHLDAHRIVNRCDTVD